MRFDIKGFTTVLILAYAAMMMTSCGDSDCVQADWVGTYSLVADTEMCSDTTVSLVASFVISAGQTDTSIDLGGTEVNFTNCTASTIVGNMELDGDKIKVSGSCEGEYSKQ